MRIILIIVGLIFSILCHASDLYIPTIDPNFSIHAAPVVWARGFVFGALLVISGVFISAEIKSFLKSFKTNY